MEEEIMTEFIKKFFKTQKNNGKKSNIMLLFKNVGNINPNVGSDRSFYSEAYLVFAEQWERLFS